MNVCMDGWVVYIGKRILMEWMIFVSVTLDGESDLCLRRRYRGL
jgi:hypothetical protein